MLVTWYRDFGNKTGDGFVWKQVFSSPSVSWFCFSIINSGSCCSLPLPDTGIGSVRWCSCAYAQLLGMERHDRWASETTDSLTWSFGAVKWWDLCRPSEWLGSVPHQVKYKTRPVSYTDWLMFVSLAFINWTAAQCDRLLVLHSPCFSGCLLVSSALQYSCLCRGFEITDHVTSVCYAFN